MRRFFALLGREIRAYFHSPIAFVVLLFFLFLTGFNFYVAVSYLNRGPSEVTVVEAFFNMVPFWFGYILVFPLLTMRLFAEEFKMGTIETLMTAPVRDWQVVLSKYLGALFFYAVLWAPSFAYFKAFEAISGARAAGSAGSYLGAYGLLLLMGMFYLAVGCLASVVTRNQIVAAVISFASITLLFFAGLMGYVLLSISPAMREVVGYFSALEHMVESSRGMIDTRPMVLYPSLTALALYFTHQAFQSRKWRM
jgi:ABC-2 type transport system permease protein